jgi:hypothetical protein
VRMADSALRPRAEGVLKHDQSRDWTPPNVWRLCCRADRAPGAAPTAFCFRIYAFTPRPRAQARSVPAACSAALQTAVRRAWERRMRWVGVDLVDVDPDLVAGRTQHDTR